MAIDVGERERERERVTINLHVFIMIKNIQVCEYFAIFNFNEKMAHLQIKLVCFCNMQDHYFINAQIKV